MDIKDLLKLTELFEIKLFWHLPVQKKNYTYTKLNCLKQNCLTKIDSLK